MAKPRKLTDEVAKRIVDAVREGMHLEHAAALAGVAARTVHEWIERGEKALAWEPPKDAPDAVSPDAGFDEFLLMLRAAEAEVAKAALEVVRKTGDRTRQRGEAWWLSKRFPKLYGTKISAEVTGADGGPLQHQHTGVVVMPAFGASDGTTFPDPQPGPADGEPR